MWTPDQVKKLRQRYGETREEFAKRFRVSFETVKSWESGRGNVSGMASVILEELEARIKETRLERVG